MRTRAITVLLGLVLAAMAAGPAAAGGQRPVSGHFTALAGPAVQRCGAGALTLGFEIDGVASHLGRLTGFGSNCTELTLATSAVAVWDGLATFTAADGSTLSSASEGSQGAPVAGVATFEIIHTITGGTGRFADAAGVWTVTGTIDFTTGIVRGQVTGWLSY
jgi:hypothetical protein